MLSTCHQQLKTAFVFLTVDDVARLIEIYFKIILIYFYSIFTQQLRAACMQMEIIYTTCCELGMTLKKLWTTEVKLTLSILKTRFISPKTVTFTVLKFPQCKARTLNR